MDVDRKIEIIKNHKQYKILYEYSNHMKITEQSNHDIIKMIIDTYRRDGSKIKVNETKYQDTHDAICITYTLLKHKDAID